MSEASRKCGSGLQVSHKKVETANAKGRLYLQEKLKRNFISCPTQWDRM
jgi:hypothetical protein